MAANETYKATLEIEAKQGDLSPIEKAGREIDDLGAAMEDLDRLARELEESQDQLADAQWELDDANEALDDSLERLDKAMVAADKSTRDLSDATQDTTGEAEKAKGAFSGLTEKLGKAAVAAGAFAAAFVIGAVLKTGVSQVFEMDSALAKIEAQTGITGAALVEFKEDAADIFTGGLGETFTDVATAMSQVERVTDATGDELKLFTENALIIQELFGADIVESVRASDKMVRTFGVDGGRAFDIITKGFQETGDPAGDLLDTFNEYSPIFAQMGFSAEQMLSIMNSGLKAGAPNFDFVTDAVKEFNIRLLEGGDAADQAFRAFGPEGQKVFAEFKAGTMDAAGVFDFVVEQLNKIEDPIARNALGVALFGTKWEDMGADVLLALDSWGEVVPASQKVNEALNDTGDSVDKLISATRNFGVGSKEQKTALDDLYKNFKVLNSEYGVGMNELTAIREAQENYNYQVWRFGPNSEQAIDAAHALEAQQARVGAIARANAADMDTLANATQNAGNVMQRDLGSGLQILQRQAMLLVSAGLTPIVNILIDEGIPLMREFGDVIVEAADSVDEFLEPILKWLGQHKKTVAFLKAFAIGIAVLTAAFVAYNIVAGIAVGITGFLAAALAILFSPITLIIVLLAALAAAYATNLFGFRDAVNSVAEVVGKAIGRIVELFEGLYNAFKSGGLKGAFDYWKQTLLESVTNLWNDVKNIDFGAIASSVWEGLKGAIEDKVEDIEISIPMIVDFYKKSMKNTAEWVKEIIVKDIENIGAVILAVPIAIELLRFGTDMSVDWLAINVFAPLMVAAVMFPWGSIPQVITTKITEAFNWAVGNLQAVLFLARVVFAPLYAAVSAVAWATIPQNIWAAIQEGFDAIVPWGGAGEWAARIIGNPLADGITGLATVITDALNAIIPDSIDIDIPEIKIGKGLLSVTVPGTPGTISIPLGSTIGLGAESKLFGGQVFAGMPYRVGELGRPETFVPAVNGTIIPGGRGEEQVIHNVLYLDGEVVYEAYERQKRRRS